eukprot:CAMPEP_0194574624 /NCGR_PEP_ID=MMETSP0292-20121207/10402_1 /TAXON_ID=39354 /ORGANISM="Heterosigma akashiwo, Strain CCMP2393" /LENGTH=323 /DNA_ID=CAMNT_0039426185 /DNA_START=33 /DNA_END=1004 /DNA_ORIENTATION=-
MADKPVKNQQLEVSSSLEERLNLEQFKYLQVEYDHVLSPDLASELGIFAIKYLLYNPVPTMCYEHSSIQNVGGGDGRLNGSAAEEIETPPVDVNLTNKVSQGQNKCSLEGCSKLLPMVLFLHGASARSTCTQLLRSCALPALLDQGLAGAGGGSSEDPEAPAAPLPFLVVSPLCPPGTEWAKAPMTKALFSLMDEIMANSDLPIDPLRIYLTGISMGGLGAYMLCVRQPHRWAAVAPICGGGRPLFAPLCERVPFWFFHSEEDNVIGVEETKNLAKVVPGARFTRYLHSPDPAARTWMVGHNCWDRTYRGCALWRWFLEHTRA